MEVDVVSRSEMTPSLFTLAGKVAIVTGGNGGIGLGMARGLAGAGAAIAVAARNADKAKRAVAELEATGVPAAHVPLEDVGDEACCRAMAEAVLARFGRIDILVNNAGMVNRKRPELFTAEEWRRLIDVNLNGSFFACQSVYPAMKRAGGGKIINIGSMMSIFGAPFATPYAASKGGLVQMTKALATAWASDNIQVNAVLPGWIETDLARTARAQVTGLNERVIARTPAARWGAPEDFTGIAVFLASPASDFITGTAIPVDGGYSAQA
jgi:2-deoxy-D-gluconate 3-dehydrogenase